MLGSFLAFLGFVFCGYYPIRKKLKEFFDEKKQEILFKFQEAEDILKEAATLWDETQKEHEEVKKKIETMKELCEKEICFIQEKVDHEISSLKKFYDKHLEVEKNHLRASFLRQIKNDIVNNIVHHLSNPSFLEEGDLLKESLKNLVGGSRSSKKDLSLSPDFEKKLLRH